MTNQGLAISVAPRGSTQEFPNGPAVRLERGPFVSER